jgi:putative two-component system response regulator
VRILVVEDEDISREILAQALTQFGHEVILASDGAEATALIERNLPSLVISDWMMPGMNGLELCRWIRGQDFPWYVYIILLTARSETEDVIEGLSAGADEFLAKPFHPAELQIRIRTADRILSLETRHLATFALAKLAESRDPETGHHLERMREYSRCLARRLATNDDFRSTITPGFIDTIYLTSPLHDIGKVGIPDSILLKPGCLSDAEFNVMKSHTLIGGETLGAMAKQYPGVTYLSVARDIVLSHHERWNGSGYPFGLKGEEIPLVGRIVALADVYDALTSKRVYKAAFTHEIARSIIVAERGEHFDPRMVDAFLLEETTFSQIERRFSEEAKERTIAEPVPA